MQQQYAPRPMGPAFARAGLVVAGLWLIWLADQFFGLNLARLGVRPGEPSGLVGIVTAHFIHGDFAHIFANTLPLLILGGSLAWLYPRAAPWVVVTVAVGAGLGTWLFARPSLHFGASGVTHGLMMFLFVAGILRRDRPSIAVAMITFFLYGGMIVSIFPQEPGISFEMHLFGFIAGFLAALALYRLDPPPPRKRYAWEDDEEPQSMEEEPISPDRTLH